MTNDLVSIVIPCFRQGRFLRGAIDSALGQDYPAVEVVVVNDGSDDETASVAVAYGDRIRYLEQQNRGLSAARNAGIRAARGRFLLFLDADDLLAASAVRWLVEGAAARDDRLCLAGFRSFTSDPGVSDGVGGLPSDGASYFRHIFTVDPLLRTAPPTAESGRLEPLPYLLYTNFGPPHCWLSSRAMVVAAGGFDESLTSCEDWDLWQRLAFAGAELITIERVAALYRRSAESMSRNLRRMLENRAAVLFKAVAASADRPERRAALGIHLYQAARRLRRRFLAHRVCSPVTAALSRRLSQLAQPSWSGSLYRWLAYRAGRISGFGSDRVALAYYNFLRPDLIEYYRSETN